MDSSQRTAPTSDCPDDHDHDCGEAHKKWKQLTFARKFTKRLIA